MPHYSLSTVPSREIMPGFSGKLLHTDRMTLAYWEITTGAELPLHDHPHEQVVNMLSGEFELTLAGKTHHLREGEVLVIPSGVPHSGKALTDCRILDVFQPVREDYRD